MRLRLFAVGAIALLAQVVLLRECEVAFFGSELVLVLGLGAWLLGSAAGAAPGRGARPPGGRAVRRLFVALGILLPLAVVLARGVRILLGGVPGAYLPFGRQLLALALCLVPVSLLLGLLFQWTARRFIATGRSPASAYALESAGGLIGGLLATLLPATGLQNWDAALLCGKWAHRAAVAVLGEGTGDDFELEIGEYDDPSAPGSASFAPASAPKRPVLWCCAGPSTGPGAPGRRS